MMPNCALTSLELELQKYEKTNEWSLRYSKTDQRTDHRRTAGLKIIFKVHRMIYLMDSDLGRILSDGKKIAFRNILL